MSYIRRNSVRLNVTRYNNDAVILNINVVNDCLWHRSVDCRNGSLTFHVIVEDLETGRTRQYEYISNQSFATSTIPVNNGSAYCFTCEVYINTKYPMAETFRYYNTYQDEFLKNGISDVSSTAQVDSLKITAIELVKGTNQEPFTVNYLFRNNHPEYFEDIQQNKGNMMLVSPKNPNGDLRSPITNHLKGIEFNVGEENFLPRNSKFGDTRLIIPLERLIDFRECILYFSDLYCHGKGHHVLLVVTRRGSSADAFCAQRLPRLPWIPRNSGFENPLLFFDQKTDVFMATPTVWVSIFYTENVRINDNTDFYERGFGRRAVGYGKPKDPSCVICNLHLIARSDIKFCYQENCLVCPCIDHTGFIKSNANGKTFPCLSNVSCRMQNLVYLIECRECGKQYVGQTSRPLRERILEHVRDIFHQRHTSLAIHINGNSIRDDIYASFHVYVLEIVQQFPENDYDLALGLSGREFLWISKLDVLWPNGLNIRCWNKSISERCYGRNIKQDQQVVILFWLQCFSKMYFLLWGT